MKKQWLIKNNNPALIVFCNGWGMDGTPFHHLRSNNYDVLLFYDYTDDSCEFSGETIGKDYSEMILAGWSMGVAFAQVFFFDEQQLFKKRIAINGTLCPIHDTFGIPRDIFTSTLRQLSDESLRNFYGRMCLSKKVFQLFWENRPKRDILSQRTELQRIAGSVDCIGEESSIYTDVMISKKDHIIPTRNQQRFWQNSNVLLLSGGHFPFYQWESWDDLVCSLAK